MKGAPVYLWCLCRSCSAYLLPSQLPANSTSRPIQEVLVFLCSSSCIRYRSSPTVASSFLLEPFHLMHFRSEYRTSISNTQIMQVEGSHEFCTPHLTSRVLWVLALFRASFTSHTFTGWHLIRIKPMSPHSQSAAKHDPSNTNKFSGRDAKSQVSRQRVYLYASVKIM